MRRFSVGEEGVVTGSRSVLASSLMLVYVPNDAFDLGMMKCFYVAASEDHEPEKFRTVRTDRGRNDLVGGWRPAAGQLHNVDQARHNVSEVMATGIVSERVASCVW
jgi:hypothetical protein